MNVKLIFCGVDRGWKLLWIGTLRNTTRRFRLVWQTNLDFFCYFYVFSIVVDFMYLTLVMNDRKRAFIKTYGVKVEFNYTGYIFQLHTRAVEKFSLCTSSYCSPLFFYKVPNNDYYDLGAGIYKTKTAIMCSSIVRKDKTDKKQSAKE